MTRLTFIIIVLILACHGKDKPDKNHQVQAETKVIVKWDTLNYVLQSCLATLEDENLKLYIDLHPDSSSDYSIEISERDKKFDIVISQPWSVTDCSYVAPRFIILNQNITLDKTHYKTHDNVHGQLNLLMLGHKDYFRERGEMKLRNNWDTVRCFGIFSSVVK